jgi:hypothetical protein
MLEPIGPFDPKMEEVEPRDLEPRSPEDSLYEQHLREFERKLAESCNK